jgi:AGZA family xanthine/uracil permease-like MFS transporter
MEAGLGAAALAGLATAVLGWTRLGGMLRAGLPDFFPPALLAGTGFLLVGAGLKHAGLLVDHPVSLMVAGELGARAPLILGVGLAVMAGALVRGVPYALPIGVLCSAGVAGLLGVFRTADPLPLPAMPPVHAVFPPEPDVFRFIPLIVLGLVGETLCLGVAYQQWFPVSGKQMDRLVAITGLSGFVTPFFGVPGPVMAIEGTVGYLDGRSGKRLGYIAGFLLLACIFLPMPLQMVGMGYDAGAQARLFPVTSSLLVIAGLLCLKGLRAIRWETPEEAIPAGLVCVMALLSSSLASGLWFGLLGFMLLAVAQGKGKTVPPVFYLLLLFMAIRYIVL